MSTQEQPDGVTKEAFRESQISGIRRKSILLSHLQNINLAEDGARLKLGDVGNFDVDKESLEDQKRKKTVQWETLKLRRLKQKEAGQIDVDDLVEADRKNLVKPSDGGSESDTSEKIQQRSLLNPVLEAQRTKELVRKQNSIIAQRIQAQAGHRGTQKIILKGQMPLLDLDRLPLNLRRFTQGSPKIILPPEPDPCYQKYLTKISDLHKTLQHNPFKAKYSCDQISELGSSHSGGDLDGNGRLSPKKNTSLMDKKV